MHEFKDIILEPRVNYQTELLRQVAHVSRRVVAIVDEGFLPHIEDKWQRLPKHLRSLDSFYYHPPADAKQAKNVTDIKETWLEFLEKQVIMEVLFDPFIFQHFVRHKSFPYSHEGFLGHETAILNVFTFWEHFQQKYVK